MNVEIVGDVAGGAAAVYGDDVEAGVLPPVGGQDATKVGDITAVWREAGHHFAAGVGGNLGHLAAVGGNKV